MLLFVAACSCRFRCIAGGVGEEEESELSNEIHDLIMYFEQIVFFLHFLNKNHEAEN